ncbi:hypothetical protein BB560_000170, partial [Smittium megazygosporum]
TDNIIDQENKEFSEISDKLRNATNLIKNELEKTIEIKRVNTEMNKSLSERLKQLRESIKDITEKKLAKEAEITNQREQELKRLEDTRQKNEQLNLRVNEFIQKKNLLSNLAFETKENNSKVQEEIRNNNDILKSMTIAPESEAIKLLDSEIFLSKLNKIEIVQATSKRFLFVYDKLFQTNIEICDFDEDENRFSCLDFEKISNISFAVIEKIREFVDQKCSVLPLGTIVRTILYYFHVTMSLFTDINEISYYTVPEVILDFSATLPLKLILPIQDSKNRSIAKFESKFPPMFAFCSLSVSKEKIVEVSRLAPMVYMPPSASMSITYEKKKTKGAPKIRGGYGMCGNGGICWWSPMLSSYRDVEHSDPLDVVYNPHSKLEISSYYGQGRDEIYDEFLENLSKNLNPDQAGKGARARPPRKSSSFPSAIASRMGSSLRKSMGINSFQSTHMFFNKSVMNLLMEEKELENGGAEQSEFALTDMFEEPEDFYQKIPEFHEMTFKLPTPIADKDDFKLRLVGSHPLWGHYLWNAAKVLVDYLIKNPELVKDKNILELGAGGGVPSLVSIGLGAKKVVLTDYPDSQLVDNIKHNVETNFPNITSSNSVSVKGFLWGRDTSELYEILEEREYFDLLILSDLVFNHSEHIPLLTSCKQLLSNTKSQASSNSNKTQTMNTPETCNVDKGSRSALVFFSHHRPKFSHKDNDFFKLANETFGFKVEKLFSVYTGPMFEVDEGDETVRGTVHAYVLSL